MAKHKYKQYALPRDYNQAQGMNAHTYNRVLRDNMAKAQTRFHYENLPAGVSARFLEKVLCEQGQCVFFKDSRLDRYYATRVVLQNQFNVYEEPTHWQAYGVNGFRKSLSIQDSVLIYDNVLRVPTLDYLTENAREVSNILRITQVHTALQANPDIILAPEELQQDALQVMKQVQSGEPIILATPNMAQLETQQFKQDRPFNSLELFQYQQLKKAELDYHLGIDNPRYTLINSPVNANIQNSPASENVEQQRLIYLNARRDAIHKINTMYGLDIKVYWARDYESNNFNATNNIVDANMMGALGNTGVNSGSAKGERNAGEHDERNGGNGSKIPTPKDVNDRRKGGN